MVNGVNFRLFVHNWFDYKEEDDANRPQWIDRWLNNYKNGKWGVGKK